MIYSYYNYIYLGFLKAKYRNVISRFSGFSIAITNNIMFMNITYK